MSNVTFPWYPKELNPNWSGHWSTKAKQKAIYKDACYWLTKEAKVPSSSYTELHLVFYKPNRRKMDIDNMLASMKSGIDGMCLAIGIDDNCFTKIVIEVHEDIGGFVKVEVK